MRKLLSLFLFLPFYIVIGQTQSITPSPIEKSNKSYSLFIGNDAFGNTYFIENNVLHKENTTDSKTYKNIQLGKITSVDILNPLKIVLFYEDFNSAVLLDNQLNETKIINFSDNPIAISAQSASTAAQNRLWVFNDLNQQIGLVNYLNNEYKTLAVPLKNSILYSQTDFNVFYWIDQEYNWYSCDLFGKVKWLEKVEPFDQIQFLNDHQFIYKKSNKLYLKPIDKQKKETITTIEISEKSFENFYYKDQFLSIFTSSEKTNYKIILP